MLKLLATVIVLAVLALGVILGVHAAVDMQRVGTEQTTSYSDYVDGVTR